MWMWSLTHEIKQKEVDCKLINILTEFHCQKNTTFNIGCSKCQTTFELLLQVALGPLRYTQVDALAPSASGFVWYLQVGPLKR